jgi:Bacterial Ig-like domain (group 3)
MNLQLLKHGIGTRAAGKAAGFAFAVWMFGMGFGAWAQVATRTHLTATSEAQATTYTAKVSDVSGNPATTGTVSFGTAKGSLGSAFVENGAATLKLDKLPVGTQTVTATYSGSAAYAASASNIAATADATGALPDFTVTASETSLTLTPGAYGNLTITVTPENGFTSMVTLTCSGNPQNTSVCIFNPATLTPLTTAPVSSALQITTQAPSGTGAQAHTSSGASHVAYAIILPGLLALAGLGALRKRSGMASLRVLGFLALLTASSLGLSACSTRYSYLNHPPPSNPGSAPGLYNITLTAYGSNGVAVTTHTLNIALTVQ